MSIRIEDLAALDFSDVADLSAGRVPATHPGLFLAEMLAEMDVTQAKFSRAIGVSPMRVSHVIKGTRPVTAELALLFGRAFDQSPQYWMNLQAEFDMARARETMADTLARIQCFGPVTSEAVHA